jgi:POT family proton-dependent oligopeptide transporter
MGNDIEQPGSAAGGDGTATAAEGDGTATATEAGAAASFAGSGDPDKRFFGQPLALAHVFGVEMWERFSFYGMQGIMLLYLWYSAAEGGLGLGQTAATGIIGAYGGAVYLSTIAGAWIADRLIGAERTLFYSAIVVMAGHIALALIPGFWGVGIGLVLVALGSGGVKANATSVVGVLYSAKDPRRDAGFSLFYLGINLGALAGSLITGFLQTAVGFHWGFGVAAIGMAVGLTQYAIGRRGLPAASRVVPNPLPVSRRTVMLLITLGAVVLIAVLVLLGVIRVDNLALVVIFVTVAATIAYFAVILTSRRITATERSRVVGFIPLFIASVAFWSLYQQQFTVLTVYSDTQLDRSIFGWEMPTTWVQSINPVFIILLSGVFAALWTKLGARQPSTPVKFALGTVVMGVAFLLFLPFAGGGANSTPLLAMCGIIFVFTIAELLLSPVGLSVATKLAPTAFHTQMVALFFLSVALGTVIAGWLGEFFTTGDEAPYFTILGAIAIVLGLALLAARKPVLTLMRGVR